VVSQNGAIAYLGTRNFREDERFRQMSVPDHVTANFPQCFISIGNGDPLAPQAVHDPPPFAPTKQTDRQTDRQFLC
jgi:acetyl esterase/lipase